MIKGVKLRKLYEQCQTEKAGKKQLSYRAIIRKELGLIETVHGMKLDRENRVLDPYNVSFREVGMELLGRDAIDDPGALNEAFMWAAHNRPLREGAGGAVVLPSHFGNVSAFVDTVSGLIDALIMDQYQSPDFIGDRFVTIDTTQVNGGKMIGARGAGGESEPLEEGKEAPMNGLKEAYIEVPDNYRFAEAIAVNNAVFIYDRTGQIQEAAEQVGLKVGRAKELDIADTVMGVVNNFNQDGKTANTYQDAATDFPNNYVNTDNNGLTDWTDINHAQFVLAQNTDPYTGWEISLRKPMTILVSPEREASAWNIARATMVREATTSALQQVRYAENPEVAKVEVVSSMIWYNRQVANLNTENADTNWFLGNFPRAFNYRLITPFSVQEDPTEVSVRKDILMCKVASIRGRAYVKNPRYAYKGTELPA